MEMTQEGVDLIKEAEGFSQTPYICPAGKLTVGYGHTGTVTSAVTKEQAEELLKQDLHTAENVVKSNVTAPISDNQFSALVSFTYNVGGTAFKNSTLLKLVNKKQYALAANEFDKWTHANGKQLDGLVTRRQSVKQVFLSGIA